ncbi:MAG: tagaturonate epimerase family protein, partial [Candidatus Aerophobetes bacterium]|nr:tagaturonate epimerase family protein [Candidatus Aerophobetes bacterium]
MDKQIVLQSFFKKYADRYKVYPSSIKSKGNNFFGMVRNSEKKFLAVVGALSLCKKFEGEPLDKLKVGGNELSVRIAYINHYNLILLREIFPHLSPSVCGIRASFGTGDRLGIATPAHIQAFKDKEIFPVLAQQSIRENSRTGRTLQQVLDDAIWGCFEAGHKGSFGADADHVKKIDDLRKAVDCGYTMFTVDPSEFVEDGLTRLSEEEKNRLYSSLQERKELERLYLGKIYLIGGKKLEFDEKSLREVVLTYFKAIKHTIGCYRFLDEYKKGEFDFEVSVDETSTPTSPLAHIFIAQEFHRNKVNFQNLALRFVGEWQKGIDYIGDVYEFAEELSLHASITKVFGGYKLSLHSGSDKFSVYSTFSRKTEGLFHIKTAGTSYLEAIKVIARKNPSLYREIHYFALKNFQKDKSSYYVTTDLSRIPEVDKLADDELETLFKKSDSRQLIHITYG